MPSNIRVAHYFLENYEYFVKTKKYEKATKTNTHLTDLIENNIDTTSEDMRLFGKKIREDKLFVESILIFDAASTLSKKIENPEEKLKMIQFCVEGMMWTNIAMIEEDPDMKVAVKDHVIPLMRGKLHCMERTSSVNEQYKCLRVSSVLHAIQWSQMLVDQLKEAEQTLREALKRMDEAFGENKIKHRVYGDLLNNLGCVCDATPRYEEAASLYEQAIDAFEAATDYGGDEKRRKRDIEQSGRNLRRVWYARKWLVM